VGFRFTAVVSLTCGHDVPDVAGRADHRARLGNGISIIIFAGIAAGLPSAMGACFELVRTGAMSIIAGLLFIVVLVGLVTFRGVRGARSAQDPGQLRQAPGRQQGLWRTELASAAEAQHGRRDPADLCVVDHPVARHRGGLVRLGRRHALAEGHAAHLSPGQPIYVLLYAR
jgi:preprotein translocase subunit SecY